MLFLVVLLGLGASFVSMSIQEVNRASRARKENRALGLAEAGLDYAAWRIYNEAPASYPITYSRTDLSEGTFSAEVDYYRDAGGAIVPNSLQVVSTGTSQGWTSQVKAVGQYLVSPGENNPIFDHALFSDSDMTITGNADITGTVHSNGNMLVKGSSTVTGDASSSGWLTEEGSHISGSKTAYAPKVSMPTVDVAYYEANASTVYNSDQTFSGTIPLDGIVFVDGDVTISGQVEGTGVIVATGQIRVNGNVTLANEDSEFALVTVHKIRINGTCRIEGAVYAHNVDVTATVEGLGNADILGCVIADIITSTGNLTVTYRQPTVELPGDSSAPTQLDVVSWRRVR
jgi:cytoskeletal protein CcmA (bactofilin family)